MKMHLVQQFLQSTLCLNLALCFLVQMESDEMGLLHIFGQKGCISIRGTNQDPELPHVSLLHLTMIQQ